MKNLNRYFLILICTLFVSDAKNAENEQVLELLKFFDGETYATSFTSIPVLNQGHADTVVEEVEAILKNSNNRVDLNTMQYLSTKLELALYVDYLTAVQYLASNGFGKKIWNHSPLLHVAKKDNYQNYVVCYGDYIVESIERIAKDKRSEDDINKRMKEVKGLMPIKEPHNRVSIMSLYKSLLTFEKDTQNTYDPFK